MTQGKQSCANAPCVWWLLCLNKLCSIFWALVQVIVWLVTIIVRVFYTLVCPIVKLVIGFLTLGLLASVPQAIADLWEAIKFTFYTAVGLVAASLATIVGAVQTAIGVQKSRPLSPAEKEVLRAIYWEALNYDAIRIVYEPGILAGLNGREYTVGFTIYGFPAGISAETLVHESVHVWQFQYEGTKYIGQSLLLQLDEHVFSPGYSSYNWKAVIPPGPNGWYLIKSAEAQARFVQAVYKEGTFNKPDGTELFKAPGGFFHENADLGRNRFVANKDDFTDRANAAWRVLRTL